MIKGFAVDVDKVIKKQEKVLDENKNLFMKYTNKVIKLERKVNEYA